MASSRPSLNFTFGASSTTNPEPTSDLENLQTGSDTLTSPALPASSSNSATILQAQDQEPRPLGANLNFAAISTDATGRQITKKIKDPVTVLGGDVHILRIYLPLDQLPPYCIDEIYIYFQQQSSKSLVEIHLCIRSLLRPCLQDVDENNELKEAVMNMVSNWKAVNTNIKFYFLRKGVQANRDCFQHFIEKDLMRAIKGLQDGDVELSEILGEESILDSRPQELADTHSASAVSTSELFEEML